MRRQRSDFNGLYRSDQLYEHSRIVRQHGCRNPRQQFFSDFGPHDRKQNGAAPRTMHSFPADIMEKTAPIGIVRASFELHAGSQFEATR